jgi:glycosyltransferase involved in cell wall biosynthesis
MSALDKPQASVFGEDSWRILLVAPNISRSMGGEAAKALRIFESLRDLGIEVAQITHARVREEMQAYDADLPIHYVEDSPLQVWLYRLKLDWLLQWVGSWLLHRKAAEVAKTFHPHLIHFTSPISPTVPYFRMKGVPTVIGPLNGNILHPPAFADRETLSKRLGALLLWPVQKISGLLFKGKQHARLLVSGGERTVKALELGGCSRHQMTMTLDSGVDELLERGERLKHEGVNMRFVFMGRLIRYKGCDLVIEALAKVPGATLDIIGDGPERERLTLLSEQLGLANRVNFVGWLPAGAPQFERLSTYRAFLFPSLAEANGIEVQEAMMFGLPVVAVDWGGPGELLNPDISVLISPTDKPTVVSGLAHAMEHLGRDGKAADLISAAARRKAEDAGFSWPKLIVDWLSVYKDMLKSHANTLSRNQEKHKRI